MDTLVDIDTTCSDCVYDNGKGLVRKKRIRVGHKASATKTMGKVHELLTALGVDKSKLSLKEKLETVTGADPGVGNTGHISPFQA